MPSLNEILGTLPSGAVVALNDAEVTKVLRESYIFNPREKDRRKRMRLRVDLYNDRGHKQIVDMIDRLFRNAKVRGWRKQFAELGAFQNLTRRIIREISTVYSEPAKRVVKSRPMNARYQILQRGLHQDRRMRVGNHMLNLCNEIVIWFDITVTLDKPVIRIVTPDNFWAVAHPLDPTELVAIIFDQTPARGRASSPSTPHYLVITDEESFRLNENGMMIGGKTPTGLTRMPMMLVHRVEPTEALLNPDPGNDIANAHMALALINVMFMKHQKSGTKQAVAAGDAGQMPTAQPMDEEHLLMVPEGVNLTTLDLGADPKSYIEAARNIIKQIASNHGIPESVFDLSYQATSGFEIELKRTSLREIRNDQIVDWRPVEFELAEIQEEVLAESQNELAFNLGGWAIDFGEVDMPQEPQARLEYWKNLKSQGLMNQIEMYQALNPESTPEEARDAIELNIDINAEFVMKLRALNVSPIAPMAPEPEKDDSDDENDENSENGPSEESERVLQ